MVKKQFYANCIRASFVKCYEFNIHAWNDDNSSTAFFWIPSLRGICEDLIVLNYIQTIPANTRDTLVSQLMLYEVQDRLKRQSAFFKASRPQQPVLQPKMTPHKLKALERIIQDIWRNNGWPNMNRNVIPPVQQMAEKHGGDVLVTLYDYMYRLTSGTVHFSVTGLLRSGWGNKMPHCKFSTANFSSYYRLFGRVYGAFMFCSYFELFPRFLRADRDTKAKIDKIRKGILTIPRWPEMVTPEEMNVDPPEIDFMRTMISIMQGATQKRLLKQ
jgi:hypothetical protein